MKRIHTDRIKVERISNTHNYNLKIDGDRVVKEETFTVVDGVREAIVHPQFLGELREIADTLIEKYGTEPTLDKWTDNSIQFPRLLAEVLAVSLTSSQYAALGESMDLTRDQIDELLKRAETVWEQAKADLGTDDTSEADTVARAKAQWMQEGEIEIDDNAKVSRGYDNGAYVQAWVWVPDEDKEDE